MGLKKGTVKLEAYNADWIKMYEQEKKNLQDIFKDTALSIEHIGSTSIIGLKAKPIIDISVSVKELKKFNFLDDYFDKYPYSYKLDLDNDEILIRKHKNELTTYLIHVMPIDSERYKNTILFRNYLNSHSDILKEYQNLKEELASKYANERKLYTTSKNDFIQKVLLEAKNGKYYDNKKEQ